MNCLDLISRAMRRIGVLAGGQLPRDTEAADALDNLIGIYRRLITEGAFGELSNAIPTGDYTASENQRILRKTTHVGSINLPETIAENGVTRPPRDCSVVIISDEFSNETVEFIYDANTQQWMALADLTLTSRPPLADRDPIGLACLLALELADDYGQQATEMTVRNAARFQMGLTHNWSHESSPAPGVYF